MNILFRGEDPRRGFLIFLQAESKAYLISIQSYGNMNQFHNLVEQMIYIFIKLNKLIIRMNN